MSNNNKVEKGSTVSVHYRGTLDDGTQFDSSYDRGEAITFEVGNGQMIAGFDAAVVGMTVGEKKDVSLASDEAYGPHNPSAVQSVPKELFEEGFEFTPGSTVQGTNAQGAPVMGTILSEENDSVTLDFNHPMAGHSLNFLIEVVDIDAETEESS